MQPIRYIFDIETNGFLEELDRVHCIVIKDVNTDFVWSFGPDEIEEGLAILEHATHLYGHNIMDFDLPALEKVYGWTFKGQVMDTLLMSRVAFSNLKDLDFRNYKRWKMPGQFIGRQGLEAWGYRLGLNKGDYAKEMKAKGLDPWTEWNQDMQDYCELDVEVNHMLLKQIMKRPTDGDWIELEMEVRQIIRRQEAYGFAFDKEAAAELYIKLTERRDEINRELREIFPDKKIPMKSIEYYIDPVTDAHYRIKGDAPNKIKNRLIPGPNKVKTIPFNPTSRDHVAEGLRNIYGWKPQEFTKDSKAKVDEEILSQLPYPAAKLLSESFMIGKRLGQLADGKQAWLKMETGGRIYGRVMTNGAVTGRMTHMSPNMAQVPSGRAPYGHECRAMFTVPEGKKLVGADASALELCCLAAYMSPFDGGEYIKIVLEGDKANGTDIHSTNARAINLDPKGKYSIGGQEQSGRDVAKTWFYAFIYGAGDYKLGQILGGGKKQGKASRESFQRNLPALGKLVKKVKHRASKRGYLLGLDGRILYCRSPHSALNTLLQSAGAVLMKRALVILDQRMQNCMNFRAGEHYEFVANVHDEWQIECDPEIAEEVGRTAVDAIAAAGAFYSFPCPLSGSYDIGDNWADTH